MPDVGGQRRIQVSAANSNHLPNDLMLDLLRQRERKSVLLISAEINDGLVRRLSHIENLLLIMLAEERAARWTRLELSRNAREGLGRVRLFLKIDC